MVIKRVTFSHFEILKHSLHFILPYFLTGVITSGKRKRNELYEHRGEGLSLLRRFFNRVEKSGGEIRETKEDVRV